MGATDRHRAETDETEHPNVSDAAAPASPRKQSTRAGTALFTVVVVIALLALGWSLWALPGWVAGWQLNRTTGTIALVALGALLLCGIPLAAGVLYAMLGLALEGLGIKMNHPEAPAALAAEESTRARATQVHPVWYTYAEEDEWEHTVAWGVLVSLHAAAAPAQLDCAARAGPPSADINPGGRYVVEDPCNLLAMHQNGMASAQDVRVVLSGGSVQVAPRVRHGPVSYRQVLKSVPLSDEEFRRARELMVWTIYYEDRYHIGANRESYPVAVCLSAEEAQAEVDRRGPVQDRADGYLSSGPSAMVIEQQRHAPEVGADTVREVLRRVACGEKGPVALQ